MEEIQMLNEKIFDLSALHRNEVTYEIENHYENDKHECQCEKVEKRKPKPKKKQTINLLDE